MATSVAIKYLPKINFGVVNPNSTRVTMGVLNLFQLVVVIPAGAPPAVTVQTILRIERMMRGFGI